MLIHAHERSVTWHQCDENQWSVRVQCSRRTALATPRLIMLHFKSTATTTAFTLLDTRLRYVLRWLDSSTAAALLQDSWCTVADVLRSSKSQPAESSHMWSVAEFITQCQVQPHTCTGVCVCVCVCLWAPLPLQSRLTLSLVSNYSQNDCEKGHSHPAINTSHQMPTVHVGGWVCMHSMCVCVCVLLLKMPANSLSGCNTPHLSANLHDWWES